VSPREIPATVVRDIDIVNKLDRVSSEYRPGSATEIENNLILNWYPGRILKRLDKDSIGSILELGIGHGYTTTLFNEHFDRHVVIEGSAAVIKQFRKDTPLESIEIVESYFEDFNTEEQFDVVLMGFVLEHVDDPELLLNRFRKFLKPGGRLFIAVPNAKSMNRRLGLAMGKIDDIYSLNENDVALGHQRQFCLDTLKDLLSRTGYDCVWEEGIYLKPLPLGYLQNMQEFDENLQAMLEVGVDFPDLSVGLLLEARSRA
jgi:SAM-dependent methyltransferase